jgi:hypothetical protein
MRWSRKAIATSFIRSGRSQESGALCQLVRRLTAEKGTGLCAVLCCCPCSSHFHWLFVSGRMRRRVNSRSSAILPASPWCRAARLSAGSSAMDRGVVGVPTGSVRNVPRCRQAQCRVSGRLARRFPARRSAADDCSIGFGLLLPRVRPDAGGGGPFFAGRVERVGARHGQGPHLERVWSAPVCQIPSRRSDGEKSLKSRCKAAS